MAKREHRNSGEGGFFTRLVRNSVILSVLDRFTDYLRHLMKDGFFGFLFSGFRDEGRDTRRMPKGRIGTALAEFRTWLCRKIENSFIINAVMSFAQILLYCKLKTYAIFLTSFGGYSAVFHIISSLRNGTISQLLESPDFLMSVGIMVISLPLALSSRTLAGGLATSYIGRMILRITGYDEETFAKSGRVTGRSLVAMILGLLLAIATLKFPPLYVLGALVVLVAAYLILIKPEIGVLTLFVFMPWLPTMVLAAVLIYTTVCYLIKLIRGKRVFKAGKSDVAVAAFMVMTLFGGLISLSSESLKPALLMTVLMLSYFLAAHLSKREWIVKCGTGAVITATVNSIYGIVANYLGIGYSSKAWIDSEMFDNISGRAVSTLENPNMLGEYLILLIPVALVMILGHGEGMRRLYAFFCAAIMTVCLVLTWSRGAWVALLLAVVILLLIWHRRSVWLIIAGGLSIPLVMTFLPSSIVSRFTSIGNMADSSTSYRVYTWQAAVKMIRANLFSGVGIGEASWRRMYPLYSYMGVEAAPHSHNLFFQITLEMGIFALIIFLIILFFIMASSFTTLRDLSSDSVSLNGYLYNPSYSKHADTGDMLRSTKSQIKLSVAGPLCGVIAVLIQGLTDYSWYNYRLYLMFWLMCGLTMAYSKSGREMIRIYSPAETRPEVARKTAGEETPYTGTSRSATEVTS
ncbi:MAG: O-antigen ligase family protein [Lachnospiraceae bacterium]|nr:O-antigen ligase family protein [Lachnospiraceae bacterium]